MQATAELQSPLQSILALALHRSSGEYFRDHLPSLQTLFTIFLTQYRLLLLLPRERSHDKTMTFGYGRVEIVAALINYTTLIIAGLYLLYEAGARFLDPQPITGWLIIIVASVALAVDLVTATLTYTISKDSMNIRAAFLHNVADALGSVAVIVAGTLIFL